MTPTDREQTAPNVSELLTAVLSKGVRLWVENGQLRYRAPRGALLRSDLQRLHASSGPIVRLLQETCRHCAGPHPLERRGQTEQIPLSYSQLRYWHSDRLGMRPTMRTVAFASRVIGSLDVALLQESASELVRRHEALRTRIVTVNGAPVQQIDDVPACCLPVEDLRRLGAAETAARVEQLIQELVCAPVRVADGPLFSAMLVQVAPEDEHVLIVTIEHIISDGFSLGVVLRDLFAIYLQGGRADSLAPVAIQSADYAVWQRRTRISWLETHDSYWRNHLAGCERLKIGADIETVQGETPHWGKLPFRLGAGVKVALAEWARCRGTTAVMGAFVAFVALVLRWYEAADAVVRYQTDGRFDPQMENSIGYFASVLNLRARLRHDDTLLELLEHLTCEYCAASEHADLSYLDAAIPPLPFTRNPSFNWVPYTPGAMATLPTPTGPLTFSPVPFAIRYSVPEPDYDWDYEPALVLQESETTIEGALIFSPKRCSADAMTRFHLNFCWFLDVLLRQPDQRIKDIPLR